MKLFKSSDEKKKSTYEESLEKYPELMNFIHNKKRKEHFIQKEQNFILYWEAYKRIVGYAIRYANDEMKSKEWREVYGILIGSVEGSYILIKEAIPMVSGDRAGVEYENKQYVDMANIDHRIYEKAIIDKENDFIIGWWHTHPGFGFFYSPVDTLTHLGYQSVNSNAIGLIFDHTKLDKKSTGIAGLRLKDVSKPSIKSHHLPSDYEIVELIFKPGKEQFISDISELIDDIKKNKDKIDDTLKYIKNTIKNNAIKKLEDQFGLLPQNKGDLSNRDSYTWDTEEDFPQDLPTFRKFLEEKGEQFKERLDKLKISGDVSKYKKEKVKIQKEFKKELEVPKDFCKTIIQDYKDKIKEIIRYWDYLDSSERLMCEEILTKLTNYAETLRDITINVLKK
ncbi:MAG: hypothetical protein EU541_02615 [Promethearchaeota archaeon]|nr:MAG: hypothetical protein EU541_02615 [Candidatus Lokiarchaeota archaeon]